MMCQIMIKKLPRDLILELHRSRYSAEIPEQITGDEKLKQVVSFLPVEVESRKIGWNPNGSTSTNSSTRNLIRQENIRFPSAPQNNVAAPDCFFCSSRNTKTEECQTDIKLAQKRNDSRLNAL